MEKSKQSAFRAALPTAAALAWITGCYVSGLWLLAQPHPGMVLAGVLPLASAMVMAAYLIHDCAHTAVFRSPLANRRLAACLGWITGSCFTPAAAIVEKHMLHHRERVDNVSFDYRHLLRTRPRLTRWLRALEWCYLPAVDWLMRALAIAAPFFVPGLEHRRPRVLLVGGIRATAFAALGLANPWALAAYALAWCLYLHVLRFLDCFQHTYALCVATDPRQFQDVARPPREYEEANTWSNPISLRRPWLNWLVLNFPFHNVHHQQPQAPWHALQRLHVARYGELAAHTLPPGLTLRNYHRFRVTRVLDDYGQTPGEGLPDRENFVGALGVSFLTQY